MERVYIAIDLKSFYASVECVERESDPLTTNLVVADESRTAKTICLAVTPSLKKYGLSGRSRLFEVEQKAKEIEERTGKKLEDTVAVPRMGLYIEYSSKIYSIYLKYFSKDDITVYSIDEVFIDATDYMKLYNMTARQLTAKVIEDVYDTTGITATAGIAPNLYLCKIAMDIVAKHIQADSKGVRIAELSVNDYRKMLWGHTPLTDFWRVGPGISRLKEYGIYTMGDVARCSLGGEQDFYNEELLYKLFGVNAELLIDHAWGYEPCTIADIKQYKPESNSISSGQVLHCAYDYEKTRLVVCEMVDLLMLDLIDKGLVTDQLVLTVGYDIDNISTGRSVGEYKGEVVKDIGEGKLEFVNPEIIKTSGRQETGEGCLSCPGEYGITVRPRFVTVKAQDRNGKEFTMEASDLLAKAICHENDHLDGILFKAHVIRMLDEDELEG